MKVTTIGIDLAKDVFQIHAIDQNSKVLQRKKLKRSEMAGFFSNLEPCLIGMEACASAHFWARKLIAMGHTVKLMAPQFVKPYVKTNKNDTADAEAICEAVTRPNMRFVAIKNTEQQTVLSIHRIRARLVADRTAQANQLRGLLSEFGIVIPRGIHTIGKYLQDILEDGDNELTHGMRKLIQGRYEHMLYLTQQIDQLEKEIHQFHQHHELSRKLEAIPGIGPLTASAFVATIGNALEFKNGRQLAAFIGLVPRQHSSGGKQNLLGISKRGDVYLRTLLIHGARTVIRHAAKKVDKNPWLEGLMSRRNKNIATVALANKNVRTIWALLAKGREFDLGYVSRPPITVIA